MCSGLVLRTSDGWQCQGTVNLKRLIWNLCLLRVGAASQSQHQGIARRTWWKSGNPRLQRLRVKQVLSATSDRSAFADLGEEKNKGPKGLRCCILDLWHVKFVGFWEPLKVCISALFGKTEVKLCPQFILDWRVLPYQAACKSWVRQMARKFAEPCLREASKWNTAAFILCVKLS